MIKGKGVKRITALVVAVGAVVGVQAGAATAAQSSPAGVPGQTRSQPVEGRGVVRVEATDRHLFLRVNAGPSALPSWVAAADLKPGEKVVTEGDGEGTVRDVSTVEQVTDVFNLSVSDDHTYLVKTGDQPVPVPSNVPGTWVDTRAGPGIVTHNTGVCPTNAGGTGGNTPAAKTGAEVIGPARNTDLVLDSFRGLGKGSQKTVRTVGSVDEMRSTFDAWTVGAERLPARGAKVPDVYRLPDGGVVQWRTGSTTGGPAIDIFPPSGAARTVHLADGVPW